ncbi:MAG: hypothetical protein KBF41_08295 [Azonexus sp.]|nr:hypothetical protein [Azonexus sp.]
MTLHICPVCGNRHEVHAVLDRLSCGRQRTIPPQCKTVFPGWSAPGCSPKLEKTGTMQADDSLKDEAC